LPIVLKTGSDRVVVAAEYADQVWTAMGGLAQATRSSARWHGFAEVDNPRVPKNLVRGAVVEAVQLR
jgi:hypothetical protein